MKSKERASPRPTFDEKHRNDDHEGNDEKRDYYDDEQPLSSYLNRGRGRTIAAAARDTEKQKEARPLIDQVTNSWQHKSHRHHRRHYDGASASSSDDDDDDFGHKEIAHCCDWEDPDSLVNTLATCLKNRRVRRTMLAVTILLFGLLTYYISVLRPAWKQERIMENSFNSKLGTFGMQDWSKFPDITQIIDLGADVMPGGPNDAEGKRRLVFVGDVHGCDRELRALMQKLDFDKEKDYLVCTGDVVSKGPDSLRVIDTLISLNAMSVRGNHEDKVIVGAGQRGYETEMSDETRRERAKGLKGVELARYLKPHHMDWLRTLPLILRIPSITPPSLPAPTRTQPDLEDPLLLAALDSLSDDPSTSSSKKKHKPNPFLFDVTSPINVVHGGLVPGVPLRRQDPYAVMNMRSVSPSSHVPSSEREKGRPWEDIWNWYHERLARHRPPKKWSWFESEYQLTAAGLAAQAAGILSVEEEDAGGFWGWLGGLFRGGESEVDGFLELKVEEPSVVVYGHDSPRSLNLRDWTKGLDTGCVRGGHLTAMVLDAWGRAHLVQVKCKNYL